MIASVHVNDDGAVTAMLDTDTDNLDELAGFVAANMLDETRKAAITAWLALHTEDADGDGEQ